MASEMYDESKNIAGNRIRTFRKHLGLTLEKFAQPLSIKGTTVSSYERGKARASEAVVRELEAHYQLNRVWYETGEGAMRLPITGTSNEVLRLSEHSVGTVGAAPDPIRAAINQELDRMTRPQLAELLNQLVSKNEERSPHARGCTERGEQLR